MSRRRRGRIEHDHPGAADRRARPAPLPAGAASAPHHYPADIVSSTNSKCLARPGRSLHLAPIAAAAVVTALAAGDALAFDIDTGNPALAVRWDNTIRANYAQRVQSRDSKIGNSAIADEGDYLFDKGDAVAKRLDLLSEFDFIYRKRYGFRVSGAAWYDGAYGDKSKSNPNPPLVNIPSYVNHEFSSSIKRFYHKGGEILDAFVFGGADLGDVPVNAKLGRHTIYWGESLYLGDRK